jgi:putative dimethyl sulfoxide reductase chaperone
MSADWAASTAAARSELYRLLADAVEYPEAPWQEMLASGELARALDRLLAQVCPELRSRSETLLEFRASPLEDLQADYLFLFEVGHGGSPPCALFGGTYGGIDRRIVMEECVRFYEHFGLKLDARRKEMPDALATQLEFLHYLAYCQSRAAAAATDGASYVRAERDFLLRHPARWLPAMREKLVAQERSSVYAVVAAVLADLPQSIARSLE